MKVLGTRVAALTFLGACAPVDRETPCACHPIWQNPTFSAPRYHLPGEEKAVKLGEIYLVNNSSVPITITDTETSCGCAIASMQQSTVPPFMATSLAIRLAPSDFKNFEVAVEWEGGSRRGVAKCRLTTE